MPLQPAVPEITPRELAECIERGDTLHVLDIRIPQRVAAGRIDLGPDEHFSNIAVSRLATMRSVESVGIDPSRPLAVICDHGNSSKPATLHLKAMGYDARSVTGGMAAWMLMSLPRALPAPSQLDLLYQFDRIGKGSLSYLLASDGQGLIIDPPRDVEPILGKVQEHGITVAAVADTHAHADYISGAPALAAFLGVPYYLHPADMVYPYDDTPGTISIEPLADGSNIQVGRCSVEVEHNPGHTEGSVTFRIGDEAAFTGDFVFVESVGRPDLAGKTEEWTLKLWNSISRAKARWPAGMIVYPAHYASPAERREDRTIAGRFGDLRDRNEALGIADPDDFAQWVRSRTTDFPDAYREIKAINVGLKQVDELTAEELEVGKNECAVA